MSSKWMARMCALACVLACVAGCATQALVPRAPTIAELRSRAAAAPKNASAARELALGEMFEHGGDPARVAAALAQAHALAPSDPGLIVASALWLDMHGEPEGALAGYLDALDAAAASGDVARSAWIETAAYAVAGLDGSVIGYVERVTPRLTQLLARELPVPARAAVADVLLALHTRLGQRAAVAQVAAAVGCIDTLRVAGPFGPRELLGFDTRPAGIDPAAPLAERYDLGPTRGTRDTRIAHANGCTLHLGVGPVAEAGTSVAQGRVSVARGGEHVLRLDTPNSAEIWIDGRSVLRVDRRRVLGARATFVPVTLAAGEHLVTVQLSTRHPNPVLELALSPASSADADAIALPYAHTGVRSGAQLYLRAMVSLLRGDVLSARQLLSAITTAKGTAPIVLLQRAGIALADPLLPDDVRQDEARRFLVAAAAGDSALWAPTTQLASLAAKSGRTDEAIAVLRKAETRWPKVPAIGFALIELLRDKGFGSDVEREVARLRQVLPDACAPLAAELEVLRGRRRMQEAEAHARKILSCDARNQALFGLLVEKRDWPAASAELERLSGLDGEASEYAWLLSRLSLAKNRGDDATVEKVVAELSTRYPRSYTGAIERIDALAASGKPSEALATLQQVASAEPASMAALQRLVPVLGGEHVLAKYRKDGKAAIDAFEKSGRHYDGPQVLVLDYLALRLFSDGSSLQLVQSVQRAQSDEAVDAIAEVDVPEGAQVLSLRAWKADGRRLEADGIAGKDTVSLPNVAPGDYVELEYLQAIAPHEGFPRGYLGDRFYFGSFEVPFDHSEMVVILPKDMPYVVDPRGPAPKLEESFDGDLRVLRFQVNESKALVAEPGSVSAREFIPSVKVGVHATFPALIDSLRDTLADRDLYDPYYASLVREIVGEAAADDYALRARRLYAWVLEHVENNDDVFSQAALLLRAHHGNRARVLHYLLGLAGIPSTLALARNFTSDATPSTMADGDTYDHLLVRVAPSPGTTQPIWLFTVERWAPFGFMPSALRGQPALLLDASASEVRVSQGLLGDDSRDFDLAVSLRKNGSARLEATETVRGSDAIAWRNQLEQIPAAELSRKFEQDYVSRLFPGATLVSLEITGREQDRVDLTLRYVAEVSSFGRSVRQGLALPPLLTTDLAATFARSATRKTTELLPSPVRNHLTARITLPKGAALPGLPDDARLSVALDERPSFSQSHKVDAGMLVIDRLLTVPALRVSPAQYPAFAEFCRRVDQAEARELFVRLR